MNSKFLPDGETVILVQITDREDLGSWWMIVNEGVVDLCPKDPGHDVDVYITAALCDLIALWMGDIGIQEAMEARAIFVDGPKYLVNTVQDWTARSPMVDVLPA
ncbi:SCP2 sterol-binding domain-containing protein [Pseudophaeobacter sp.]|uniref:SCP2 sterol-binding domain-containing protein n=1 Tax=Pseudophaeobacter sp. TaxID=1971739 RepID=UPI00405802C4